jgi:hypothetical protein
MPVVLREGPYRVFIYRNEPDEPPHVHVLREACEAKFQLVPLTLCRSRGFRPIELRRIERMLGPHATELLEAWHALHVRRPARPPETDPDR